MPARDCEIEQGEVLQEASAQPWLSAEAEKLLDAMFAEDPELTAEQRREALLTEMQRDSTAHVHSELLRALLSQENFDVVARAVLPHLHACGPCCRSMRDALHLLNAPEDHPAYALLKEAEEGARWQAAAREATRQARAKLLEQGIGYTYGRSDGSVYRRLPDGTEVQVEGPRGA